MPARLATSRNVNVWSLGEHEATTRPSRPCSWASCTISCCVESEQVNIAERTTTTSRVVLHGGHDLVDIDVVPDIAAALADVHADLAAAERCAFGAPLDRLPAVAAHAGTFTFAFSR